MLALSLSKWHKLTYRVLTGRKTPIGQSFKLHNRVDNCSTIVLIWITVQCGSLCWCGSLYYVDHCVNGDHCTSTVSSYTDDVAIASYWCRCFVTKNEDLAVISAQQYYVDYGSDLLLERLQALLQSYLPDGLLQNQKDVNYWLHVSNTY